MSRPIPKFSSFKPKPRPEQSAVVEREQDYGPHRRRRHSHGRHDENRHSQSSDPRHGHRRDRDVPKSQESLMHVFGGSASDALYTSDRKGDSRNLTYASLDKHDVPEYFRTGSGRVIGLPMYMRIERAESNHFRIVLRDLRFDGEAEARPLLEARKLPKEQRRPLRKTTDRNNQTLDQDFVQLKASRKRKRVAADEPLQRLRNFGDDGEVTLEKGESLSEAESSSDNSDSEDHALAAQLSMATLFRSSRDDPTNHEKWIALIDSQIDLFASGADAASLASTQRLSLAKVRLDLYEKAIAAVLPPHKAELVDAMLGEGALIWNMTTYIDKIKQALRQSPTSIVLWKRLLNQLPILDQARTTWTDHRRRYLEILKDIRSLRSLTGDEQTDRDLGNIQIYVVLHLLRSTFDAGYHEQAIVTWQALMTLFVDRTGPSSSFHERLSDIEAQLKSDKARFGQKESMMQSDTGPVNQDSQFSFDLPFRTFARHEVDLDHIHDMPLCEDACDPDTVADDPFVVVFFRDIVDVLETTDLGLNAGALTDAFLSFFGLPAVSPSISTTVWPWRNDNASTWSHIRMTPSASRPLDLRACAVLRATPTNQSLWSDNAFPPLLTGAPRIVKFIDEGLEQLADARDDNAPLLYYRAAFQTSYMTKSAPKLAKRLLRVHSSHLQLYDAAAHAEIALGHHEKAFHIWNVASSMPTPVDVSEEKACSHKASVLDLSISSAWADLNLGKVDSALQRLYFMYHIDVGETPSSAAKLSLTQNLQQGYSAALHHQDFLAATSYASAQSLLKYLEPHEGLPKSLAFLDSLITDATTARERSSMPTFTVSIHQLQARLIAHHLRWNKPHRPASLLSTINSALVHSPGNTTLLSVYDTLTQHTSLLTPLLSSTPPEHVAPRPSSPATTWLHAIRRAARGLSPESTRSLFRAALLDEASESRLCPTLWNEWLSFEQGMLSRSVQSGSQDIRKQWRRVWDVWTAGRQALPWNKNWVLSGFEIFDGAPKEAGISKEALRAAYEDMLDRSLRIRKEIVWEDEGNIR